MDTENLISEIKKVEHGFTHIIDAGNKLLLLSEMDRVHMADGCLKDDSYQVRMLGVYLLGELAAKDSRALKILEIKVVKDDNWRVQEMLAKAIDRYCAQKGYEQSLPEIEKWLASDNSNMKRAIVEGLRIWTSRPYFNRHPEIAVGLISRHKADESEYVRKSVGNALRDISKKHPDLVDTEIKSWDLTDVRVKLTYKHVHKARH